MRVSCAFVSAYYSSEDILLGIWAQAFIAIYIELWLEFARFREFCFS